MAWRHPGTKPLCEPMMVSLPTDICITQPQWVNHQGELWSVFCECQVLPMSSWCCVQYHVIAYYVIANSNRPKHSCRKSAIIADHSHHSVFFRWLAISVIQVKALAVPHNMFIDATLEIGWMCKPLCRDDGGLPASVTLEAANRVSQQHKELVEMGHGTLPGQMADQNWWAPPNCLDYFHWNFLYWLAKCIKTYRDPRDLFFFH